MPHSLRAKLSGLRYKGILEDKDYKRLCHALDLEKAEQEPCEDAISREDALEALNTINGTAELDKAFEVIENLPSVRPQEPKAKTGRWLDCSNGWMCSQCERDNSKDTNYCPNCGAEMEGSV